jgi:hypothetical protein
MADRPEAAKDIRRRAEADLAAAARDLRADEGADLPSLTLELRRQLLLREAERTSDAAPAEGASALGAYYEGLLGSELAAADGAFRIVPSLGRRRAGAHFTSPEVAHDLVRRTLEPAVRLRPDVLALRLCDPAMGSGVFLAAAAAFLAEAGSVPIARVVRECLFGVDRDPLATLAARIALARLGETTAEALAGQLITGNAVVGSDTAPPSCAGEAFDWSARFPEVVARDGFDAIVGNPPWVAYAGRAAQPLEPALHAYYRATYPAFAGYRTLQGVFVSRAVRALAPGGRLGLVVPTSMADLAGYAPVRRDHDALAEADRDLPDYGADAFDGVFQPAMGLVSTRRAAVVTAGDGEWDLARSELDDETRSLLAITGALPSVPAASFGERGFQTYRGDTERLSREPDARRSMGLRVGKDVRPFAVAPPSLFVDPREFEGRLRDASAWADIAGYVRQTARYPLAAKADGGAFRNSVLAVFDDPRLPIDALLAYLNAWPIRFFHYARFRDARQGMPQIKIGHLRRLPLPAGDAWIGDLARIGAELGGRNTGVSDDEQRAIDTIVSAGLGLGTRERERVARFSRGEGAMVRPRSAGRPSSTGR